VSSKEVRRRAEGRVHDSIADKEAVAHAYPAELAADPVRARRFSGWPWIRRALDALPRSMSP
jgi:hypothetical protein